MWKEYFGEGAKIYGIDIDPRCKDLEEENIEIFVGSQSDRNFLQSVRERIPPIDILIDDGGHSMVQQIAAYEMLFDHVKESGVYLCEDLHTSYWATHGGGYRRPGTFIEYSKNFIDFLHAGYSEEKSLAAHDFTRTVRSLHYYDSVLVIEKSLHESPYNKATGQASFSPRIRKKGILIQAGVSIFSRMLRVANTALRRLGLGRIFYEASGE